MYNTNSTTMNNGPYPDTDTTEFILVPTKDFQQMYEDMVNMSDMIDYLIEHYLGYERLIIFQAALHHEPVVCFQDTHMIKDMQNQAESIADRWSDIDIIPINQ